MPDGLSGILILLQNSIHFRENPRKNSVDLTEQSNQFVGVFLCQCL